MFFTPVLRRSAYIPNPRVVDARLERWLGEALGQPLASERVKAKLTPDEKTYTLELDLPGVTKEQLRIGVEANVVRVESVSDAPRRYQFTYELPAEIDPAHSQAKLELGVLTLTLGKLAPASRSTSLPIA